MILSYLINKFKKKGYYIDIPSASFDDLSTVQASYARIFSTDDGKRVLDHLQRSTFMRALSSDSLDTQIHYMEGQRALVALILRHIVAGRQKASKNI